MRIAVIGTGYVGLVTGTVLAELGHTVTAVDIVPAKIARLAGGEATIYEPGLEELIQRNLAEGRLQFTTDHAAAVRPAKVIFNAVDTPAAADGSVDLTAIKAAARQVGQALATIPSAERAFLVVVNKSTVPIGTADLVKDIIRAEYDGPFDVVSNPEFLAEGTAVSDCFHPDRIVIGEGDPQSRAVMEELYRTLNAPILFTDVQTAELIKYASNSFLAMSISFINNLAWLCERVGADITQVSEGMRLDQRIGRRAFLSAGPGYGGSCFPKDVKGIIATAAERGVELSILRQVEEVNNRHRTQIGPRLAELLGGLAGKKIAVWGLTFKPGTDDLRESVAQVVIPYLLEKGAAVAAFDPVANKRARSIWPTVTYCPHALAAVTNADALLILTEWKEFTAVDWSMVKQRLRQPVVYDLRNLYSPAVMSSLGFTYVSVGRPAVGLSRVPSARSADRQVEMERTEAVTHLSPKRF